MAIRTLCSAVDSSVEPNLVELSCKSKRDANLTNADDPLFLEIKSLLFLQVRSKREEQVEDDRQEAHS